MALYQTKKIPNSKRINQQRGNEMNGRKHLEVMHLIKINIEHA